MSKVAVPSVNHDRHFPKKIAIRNLKVRTSILVATRGLILPLLLILVWQLAGTFAGISNTVLPTPIDIVKSFQALLLSGELWIHLKISVTRALSGFLLGASLGLLLGTLTGLSRTTEQVADPSLQMLRTVPHLALAPLFILWFGLGELSKVLLIALGAFFPLYVNTLLGIRGVDKKLFEVTRILEFSRLKQVTKLILPASLPNILLGVRLSLGSAWLGLVVSELMGASEGIGYLIMDARQFTRTDVVFVGIIIFALGGKLADSFVRILESKLLKWRDSYQGKSID
ncbi:MULTISPECIES: ABC transporter permease [Ectobacillus]|jgi:sulfonate transport system permease protein|uniref:ABC transporter permease n=1 Tax=Ectobacillus TaxID=2837502 RepID=UPI000F5B2E67|nr:MULTISPECIES: ABC transporter permease [Ectobacillus]UOY92001.1 ABC transporter permease [Ectobacillus sp. JY-23]